MKKIAALLLFAAATLTALCAGSTASAQDAVRIMSYNVRNGRGLDNKSDYARIGNVIKAQAPEVCAIQELDCKTKRSKGADVLVEIAKTAEMIPSYGPAIDYQGGKYGIGILTKEKPLSVEYLSLPGREEQRCLLVVELEKFVFCCSHWSLTAEDRLASVAIITGKMKEQKKPVFVCGDFNEKPDGPAIKELFKDWTVLSADALTFPADKPSIRIDYICVADPTGKTKPEQWRKAVKNAEVVNEPVASDHRPIIVDLDPAILK